MKLNLKQIYNNIYYDATSGTARRNCGWLRLPKHTAAPIYFKYTRTDNKIDDFRNSRENLDPSLF